ncbi:recombinase family protein [Mycolicibacterium fluoranthenivorans]|uniref:recombinase family protein n=1 Tax=Mycolicibacterium fluoranthenivorans TaxID=258505 RepID=UPI000B873C37|nr:recombinase family protein [Mycolicibacterium fluoranthenivorans]
MATAVTYLRVSTKRQLYTAIDIDPDGNSITTQREVTESKANALEARIDREFIEPGHSAKTLDERPVFRELLAYLHENREIDYVIVYMRSRAFRNHFDAAIVQTQLKTLGVRLVSAKEDFGEGPTAVAMEGMLDIMNGLQNTLQGLDVATKMRNKAKAGGTVSLAKLGYKNVRVDHHGRQINTIALDPERAPLVRKAWELYATGDYAVDRLEATMADLGLTARPTKRSPAGTPVSASKLHRMLSDPYYVGFVVYKGEMYPGRHEPIVSQALFERVQEVLNARSARGQRDRIHQHYLKGMLFCQRCRDAGRTSRMIYTQSKGNGGVYAYFACRGRQDKLCDLPHLRVELVENAVSVHYSTLRLPIDFIQDVRNRLEETVTDSQTSTRELHASLTRRLRQIDVKESRLIDLAADGDMPRDKIRAKLNAFKVERANIEASLARTGEELSIGATVLRDALHLVEDPQTLYASVPNDVRRHLNQTFYERLYVDDLDIIDGHRTPLFTDLHAAKHAYIRRKGARGISANAIAATDPTKEENPNQAGVLQTTGTDSLTLASVFLDTGSSKNVLVGLTGFEPATT